MTEENYMHINVSLMAERIKDYDKFAIVHTHYTTDLLYDIKANNRYHITPIKDDGDEITTNGVCYDNEDVNGNVIMSREEMMMKFSLTFGKEITHQIDYESDGFHSNDKCVYIGTFKG